MQQEDTHVIVLYDYEYAANKGRTIQIKKGEKLYLINKTNDDWWQVIRSCEERPFYVPAEHVCEPKRKSEPVEYQNLETLRDERPVQKPVPKTRTKLQSQKDKDDDSDSSRGSGDRIDNRMKNSYNLKSDLKIERKHSVPIGKRKPLEVSKNLSQSLEKLAEEIKFEPRNSTNGVLLENRAESQVKNHQNKTEKTEDKGFFRASLRGKCKDADLIQQNCEIGKKNSMRGKSSDASIVLNERKPATKSRGLFSSFKRKKQAFVLSSSWEGLDKISEIADKPMVTPFGLQRSKTFMTPERPKPKTRLDGYHEPSRSVSSFKPKIEEIKLPERPVLVPFATRKASLVRNRRVDSTKSRIRVPATPPPDEAPVRDLGEGWGEYQCSDGRPYFYNRITAERNLKPPRKISNLQISGSKDSICSDLSSPVRSSPSPKFSSGTSLDRLTPTKYASRQSLDCLTPIELPALGVAGPGTPPYPSDKPPFDVEEIEALDRLTDEVPDGWVEELLDVPRDPAKPRRTFVHQSTKQRYSTWPCDVVKKLEPVVSLPTVFATDSESLANCCKHDERKDELQDWVRSDEPVSRDSLLPPTYQDVFKTLLEAMRAEIMEIDQMMAQHEPDPAAAASLEQYVNTLSIDCGLSPKIDTIFDNGRKLTKPPVPPRRKKKPLYEEQDLMLLERATESTKVKRKPSMRRKASQEHFYPREDVIIEWTDHLDSLHEPVVLEAKTIPAKCSSDSSVDLSEDGPLEEWAVRLSDSDDGEVVLRSNSWNHSRDRPLCSEDLKNWCSNASFDRDEDELLIINPNKPRVVSYSITVHLSKVDDLSAHGLSKSLDFFNDLADEKVVCNMPNSLAVLPSVEAWMAYIRLAPYEEADFDEWFAANDSEGRVYFYHEHSDVSRWQLPDLPDPPKGVAVGAHNGEMYSIQRSATDTAIPSEVLDTRLRRSVMKDDVKGRATKTQSMILDGKLDIPTAVTKSGPLHLSEMDDVIKAGSLNRAKVMENGKRIRKNWVSTFSVLCKSLIFFFKDEKTFRQVHKNVALPKGSFVSHSLAGAEIEEASNVSGRKNVYRISWPDTEILIQTEKKVDAEQWVKEIKSVINSIPKTRKDSSDSIDKLSPNKVRRSKSVKTKTKGSNEDLNSGGNKNIISEILKKFISRRPSSDLLRQKGILKDEPVFGCSLEQITTNRVNRIPEFVERCVEIIESSEENLKTDGLYRASGNLSQVQKIRLEVDQNNLSVMEQEEDVHVLTGSLKLFFRELKEPLIPSDLTTLALGATRNENEKQKAKELKQTVEKLAEPNRATLRYLLTHLLQVEKYKEFNRMNFSNLAIVFGPALMWPVADTSYMALHLMQQNEIIEALLTKFHEIF